MSFLLKAKARSLSLKDVYSMGEDKAYELFQKLRWPETNGKPECPKCGHGHAYNIKSRRQFECKACKRHYSVTSQTIFAGHKLSFTDMLAAIAIVSNAAKGISALQLARDLNVQHKTAWILIHKLREAMAAETHNAQLDGTVEVDGMYVGGHIRPANLKENRVDRRLVEHQTGKRRVVVVARERDGRTLPTVHEHESDGVETITETVSKTATIHADEASHWDALHGQFKTLRINHSEAYSLNGVCTNQAESYFSRLRRMIRGQHHHVSPRYLHAYAEHAAWLEDHRKLDNGAIAKRIVGLAMGHPVSMQWKGYWQRAN